jgi:ribosomal protein S12 methylthiotransferase
MPTIALVNLGCSKNVVDGQKLIAAFEGAGYTMVDDPARAEFIIVNTCAFIKEATREAIDTIVEMAALKKTGVCRFLAVAGCFSQRYGTKARADLPEVDAWVPLHPGPRELERIFSITPSAAPARRLTESLYVNYLKIADGCSHACAFCVIPSIRGKHTSRPMQEIIDEARWLQDMGTRELILVSQDTSLYGRDIGLSLPLLIETLLAATAIPWIRLMYLHPCSVDDRLLHLAAADPRICPYFDIPLQHCNDAILKSMGRMPDKAGMTALIGRVRALVPDAAVRTSFITGYPGETAAMFRELLRFVEEMRFDKIGVFPYSPEEGTRAARIRPRPADATARRRSETLMELQQAISRELLTAKTGRVVPVMIDALAAEPGANAVGRTRWDAPEVDGTVYIEKGDCTPGDIAQVRITGASDHDLFGEIDAEEI